MTISATIDLNTLESPECRIDINYDRKSDNFRSCYSVIMEDRYRNLIRRRLKFDHGTVERFISRQSPASAEMTYVEDIYCEAFSRSIDSLSPDVCVHDRLGKPRVSLTRKSFDGQRFIGNHLPFIVEPTKRKEEDFIEEATISLIADGLFVVLSTIINEKTRLTLSCDPSIYDPHIKGVTTSTSEEQALYVEYCKSCLSKAVEEALLHQTQTTSVLDYKLNVCSALRMNASLAYLQSDIELPRPNLYMNAMIKLTETHLGFDQLFNKTLLDISRS